MCFFFEEFFSMLITQFMCNYLNIFCNTVDLPTYSNTFMFDAVLFQDKTFWSFATDEVMVPLASSSIVLYYYIKQYITSLFLGHSLFMYLYIYIYINFFTKNEIKITAVNNYINSLNKNTMTIYYCQSMLIILFLFNVYNILVQDSQLLYNLCLLFDTNILNITTDQNYLLVQSIFIFLYWLYIYNQYILKLKNNLKWEINQDIIVLLNIATYLNLKLITCVNLIYFVILIESLTLLLIILCATIGYLKEDFKSAEEASFKLYINNAISTGFLLLGIGLIYGSTGLVNFSDIAFFLNNMYNNNLIFSYYTSKEILLLLGVIFLLVGIFTKMMQSPFHLWAKDIYEGSSLIFTTYLATLSKVGIIFFFINNILYLTNTSFILNFCFYVGLSSMLIGILGAIQQTKLKSFLAYSSIAALGPVLVVCSASTYINTSIIFSIILLPYIVSYLFILLLLFFIINRMGKLEIIKTTTKFSEIKYNYELAGLWHKHKFLSFCLLVIFFSLLAIPPFFNFFLKTYILIAFLKNTQFILGTVYLLYGVLGSIYYLKLIKIIIFDKSNKNIIILKTNWIFDLLLLLFIVLLILFFVCPKLLTLWYISTWNFFYV